MKREIYTVGAVVGARAARLERAKTKPPSRHTQSTLMDEMLMAHRHGRTEEEKAILRKVEGIGTSRTREPTITELIRRGFLDEVGKGKGRHLVSSVVARDLVDALPDQLTSMTLTAKWELAFRVVEKGNASVDDVTSRLRGFLDKIVQEAKATQSGRSASQPHTPKAQHDQKQAPEPERYSAGHLKIREVSPPTPEKTLRSSMISEYKGPVVEPKRRVDHTPEGVIALKNSLLARLSKK